MRRVVVVVDFPLTTCVTLRVVVVLTGLTIACLLRRVSGGRASSVER
jgi:hypothetical protein